MTGQGYRAEVVDETMTITLDRPERANAISEHLAADLCKAIDGAVANLSLRAIVLSAVGTSFCSGADLTERAVDGPRSASAGNIALYRRLLESPIPVVAQINGHVRAGGVALVAACDIAICAAHATFGVPEVHRGLVPAVVSVTMQRCMSPRSLQRYLLSGEVFDADEARQAGLVSAVVNATDLDNAVEEVLTSLRLAAPESLRATKSLLADVSGINFDELYRARTELSTRYYQTPTAWEGMRAFLEKRPAAWTTRR